MVSESELVERLREILRESDLETTTAAAVRRRLEQDFSIDLNDRRAFIRDQIDLILQQQQQQDDHEEEAEVEEEEEEEEVDVVDGEEENGSVGENEVDEEEEEEGRSKKQKRSSKMDTDGKKKGGGFSKPCALSPQLQEFLGASQLARTEVVKQIWAYIREKDLQNPKDKRKILCDEALHAIFRVNSIDMFQMNKALSKHIWPLDEAEAGTVKPSQNEKQRKQSREVEKSKTRKDEPKRKEKPKRMGSTSGLTAPVPLSNALVKFFGTGEQELSRADVVKRMWQYIKENELQDPSDKRMILCDDKLKELFEVDSFHGFTVSKLLTPHFIKTQG